MELLPFQARSSQDRILGASYATTFLIFRIRSLDELALWTGLLEIWFQY